MAFVLLLVMLVVIGGIAVVAAGRGVGLQDVEPDRSLAGSLPEGDVDRAGVDGLRFTLALRGYRMNEVDAVLDRLVEELESRDARIAELEGSRDVHEPDADARPAPEG